MFSTHDRSILRALAQKQAELAHSGQNLACVELWKRHRAFRGERPLVCVEVGTFEQELITPLLRCRDAAARRLEHDLYHTFINQDALGDDTPIPPYFPVRRSPWFHPFGFERHMVHAEGADGSRVGYQFEHPIADLEEDWEKLGPSRCGVDMQVEADTLALAQDCFGDILPAKLEMVCLAAVPTQQLVHLMGMEALYFALHDCPGLVLEAMDRLADDYIALFRQMEADGLLLPTTTFEPLGQGTFCFTDELPATGRPGTKQLWGFMDSQESVGVSPGTFATFFFPAYKKIAEVFGLLSYGCCEPVDPIWDLLETLPNLRNVSVSAWANEHLMGERLRRRRIVYHRKPSPNFLGIPGPLDENGVAAHINATLRAAQGCELEITQRDVYTIGNDLPKARRYVELIRQCIENNW